MKRTGSHMQKRKGRKEDTEERERGKEREKVSYGCSLRDEAGTRLYRA